MACTKRQIHGVCGPRLPSVGQVGASPACSLVAKGQTDLVPTPVLTFTLWVTLSQVSCLSEPQFPQLENRDSSLPLELV